MINQLESALNITVDTDKAVRREEPFPRSILASRLRSSLPLFYLYRP